jgi:hypothetical protein
MSTQYARPFSRRQFLGGLTLAGTVGLTGLYPRPIAAEPPPETTRITLLQPPGICTAPVAVAEALLRAEDFSEVHYIPTISGVAPRGNSPRARPILAWPSLRHSLSRLTGARRVSY